MTTWRTRHGLLGTALLVCVLATSAHAESGWSVPLHGSASQPVPSGDRIYIGSADGSLWCFAAASGEVVWRYRTAPEEDTSKAHHPGLYPDRVGGVVATPVVHDGVVYVGSTDGRLHALGADGGELRWSLQAGHPVRDELILREDLLYVAARGPVAGAIVAVDAASGSLSWSVDVEGPLEPLTVAANTIYAVHREPGRTANRWTLTALDAKTGAPHWARQVAGRHPQAAQLASGRVVVAAYAGETPSGPFAPTLHAFDPASGAQDWTFQADSRRSGTRGELRSPFAYLATNRTVHAVDLASGVPRWDWNPDQELLGQNLFVADVVLVAAKIVRADYPVAGLSYNANFVHGLDPKTGKRLWSRDWPANPWVRAVLGETAYVQSDDQLIALDLASGQKQWSFATGKIRLHFAHFSAGPVLAGDRILFATRTNRPYGQEEIPGRLYSIDARTGAFE